MTDLTTLPALLVRYLNQYARTPLRSEELPRTNTLKARRLALERFGRFVAEHGDAPGLTVNLCKEWYLSRAGNGVSSTNQTLSAITGLLRFLADESLFDRRDLESWLSFQSSQFRKPRRRPNYKYLRPDQLVRLFAAFADQPDQLRAARDIAFFGLILFGPARLGENRLLDVGHVSYCDTAETSSRFHIHLPASIAKDHEDHELMIFEDASLLGEVDVFTAFRDYYQWRTDPANDPNLAPASPLFVALLAHHRLRRPSARSWGYVFDTAASNAKLEVTSHWLRHTYGEEVRGELNDRDMQQIYGHTDPATTENYTHHKNDERLLLARHRAAQIITRQT